jgi:hypothetical protein
MNASLIVASSSPAHAQAGGKPSLGQKLRTGVEQDVLRKVQPYFPKAKTLLDRQGNLIILTCVKNIGPAMLQEIRPQIENQFSGLVKGIFLAVSGARRVEVGFERDVLVFDLSTHRDAWIPGERIPGYIEGYAAMCD